MGSAEYLAPPDFSGSKVRLRNVGIDLDAVTGLVLNAEITVLPHRTFLDDEGWPPVDPLGEFMNAELAHGGCRMGAGNGTESAGRVVGGGPDVVQVSKIGDLLRFQKAT